MKKIKRDLNGLTVEQIQKDIEMRIEEAKAILDNKQYKFQEVNLEEEVGFYLKQKIKEALLNEQILYWISKNRKIRIMQNKIKRIK